MTLGVLTATVAVAVGAVFTLVNREVTEPYMDEIFHVPQAQRYCAGDLATWDPKITTLPGLYVLSVGYAAILRVVSGLVRHPLGIILPYLEDEMESDVVVPSGPAAEIVCTLAELRSLNCLLLVGTFLVLLKIIQANDEDDLDRVALHLTRRNEKKTSQESIRASTPSTPATLAVEPSSVARVDENANVSEDTPADAAPPFALATAVTLNETSKNILCALCLMLMPVSFFSSFLYYTDAASTFFVLLMVLMARSARGKGRKRVNQTISGKLWISALTGLVAVTIRQNNIIWVLFVLGTEIVSDIEALHWNRIYPKFTTKEGQDGGPVAELYKFSITVSRFISFSIRDIKRIVKVYFPFLLTVVSFCIFFIVNGSVVVGDHERHQFVFHFAQLPYFTLFACSFLSVTAIEIASWTSFFKATTAPPLPAALTILPAFAALATTYSYVHPFILADNRHYIFYMYKDIFRRFAGFLPTVLYAVCSYCTYLLWDRLRSRQTPLHQSVFLLALMLALLPTHLVEFRYYIIPFYLLHLHSKKPHATQLLVTFLLYLAVNTGTFYVFLEKPYTWEDGSVARFMW